MTEEQPKVSMSISIAYSSTYYLTDDTPKWYDRTFMLAMAFAPLISGLVGLFNRDVSVWVWTKEQGFKPVVIAKRRPLP